MLIDVHCHLLPGIDDGPETMEEALEMCRTAVANGIRYAVATPHIAPGRWENTLESITTAHAALCAALAEAGIALELGMAAEVRLDPSIIDMVEGNSVPFLGEHAGAKLLLLEFPHSHIPPGSEELVDWLAKRNIRPLIAHPERNGDVMRDLNRIMPFVQAGCLLQVTAGSLLGTFGDVPRRRGRQLLENNLVFVIASDAHNLQARPPRIEPGRIAAAAIVGEEASWTLVRDHPADLAAAHFGAKP